MYPSLNTCFNLSRQMLGSTCVIYFLSNDTQDVLHHESVPGLSHPNRPDPWLLIQCNHWPAHHFTVGSTRGPPVYKPLREVRHCQTQIPDCRPKSEEPVLLACRGRPPCPVASKERPRNLCHRSLSHVHWDELWRSYRVGFKASCGRAYVCIPSIIYVFYRININIYSYFVIL